MDSFFLMGSIVSHNGSFLMDYFNKKNPVPIYLLVWISKDTMLIFGELFLLGIVFTFLRWIGLFV